MGWADIGVGPDYISASQIGMFLRCPRQYYFRYIKGLKRPPSLSMIVGTAMHKSAEVNYAAKFKTKKPVKLATALDACSDEFQAKKGEAEKVGKKEEGAEKDRAIAMSKAHYTEIAPLYQPVAAPELEFKVAVPGLKKKLLGYIDVIVSPIANVGKKTEKVLNKRVIRDNKTSGRKFDKLAVEISSQMTAYAHAHNVLFGKLPDAVGLDIMIAKKDTTIVEVQLATTTRTAEEVARFAETAVQVDKGISAGSFPPCDDAKICSWCGYRSICQPQASKRVAMVSFK